MEKSKKRLVKRLREEVALNQKRGTGRSAENLMHLKLGMLRDRLKRKA
jgi:hypothetical protein